MAPPAPSPPLPPSTDAPQKNMLVQRADNVLLVMHTAEAPGDDDWNRYLESILAMGRDLGGDLRRGRILVVTDGGSPGIAQRAAAIKTAQQMHGSRMPVAVLSSSRFVRILVATVGVLQVKIKAFSPLEVPVMFDFLGLTYLAARPVWTELERMDRALRGTETLREARRAFERW